jgi:hypothetical protein
MSQEARFLGNMGIEARSLETDGQDTLYLLTILHPDFRYHVTEVYVTSQFAKTLYWDCPDS